jgi:hypothetical protein
MNELEFELSRIQPRGYCSNLFTVVAVIHANMLMSGVVEAAYDSHGFQFSHTITTPEDYN